MNYLFEWLVVKLLDLVHLYSIALFRHCLLNNIFETTHSWFFIYYICYRIFSNKRPRRLFNSETLRCGAYWRAALKRGWRLFQCKINYSHEISRLCNFFFPNKIKWPPLWCTVLDIPELQWLSFFDSLHTSWRCIIIYLRLNYGCISNYGRILRCGIY